MRRTFAVLTFCLLGATVGWADDGKDYHITSGVGLSAGMVGGFGFSYRMFPGDGLGLHTSIIYWNVSGSSFFNMAFEPLFVLDRTEESSLYLIAGASIFSNGDDASVAAGLGMGFGKRHTDRIWWSAELVLTGYQDWFLPLPQVSIHYVI